MNDHDSRREQIARMLYYEFVSGDESSFDGSGDWREYNRGECYRVADDLLSLLSPPAEPAEKPAPCGAYSNGTDGWSCAAVGPHGQHHNAAGDVHWGDA